MSIVPPDRFVAAFARLKPAERAAFVGAVWETRGRTADRDGTLVVLDGDTRATFDPRPQRLGDAVDLVVVPKPSARLRDAARRTGVTVVDAEDVRALLLYGIEREAAERLYQTHTGQSLSVDRQGQRRLRDRLAARNAAGALGVLAVIVLVVVALPPGVGPDLASGGATEPAERVDTPEGTPEASGSVAAFPPGVGRNGTVRVSELSAAHVDALRGVAFTMQTRYDGPPGGSSYESATASETTLYVENHSLFRYERVETVGSGEARSVAVYADGRREFFRYEDSDGIREGYSAVGGQSNIPLYVGESRSALQRFLTTTETRVERLPKDGRVKVYATGSPERLNANVSDYRARAVVRSNGLVSSLAVEYVNEDTGTTVTFRQEFDAVGTTSVPEPDWYADRAE